MRGTQKSRVRLWKKENGRKGQPPETRFIDAYLKYWNNLPEYDINYFEGL